MKPHFILLFCTLACCSLELAGQCGGETKEAYFYRDSDGDGFGTSNYTDSDSENAFLFYTELERISHITFQKELMRKYGDNPDTYGLGQENMRKYLRNQDRLGNVSKSDF